MVIETTLIIMINKAIFMINETTLVCMIYKILLVCMI